MICSKCGRNNTEGAKFCQHCGAQLTETVKEEELNKEDPSENKQSIDQEERDEQWSSSFIELLWNIIDGLGKENNRFFTEPPHAHKEKECSFCGSSNTQLITQNTTDIKSNGYNWVSGCCGTCLLGPFGILCGMLGGGSKVKITNETWWLCIDCGKKHISQSSALEKADMLMRGILGNSVVAGIVLAFVYAGIYEGIGEFFAFVATIILSMVVPVVLTSINYDILFKDLGYSIIDILPIKKRKEYSYILFGAMVITFLIAWIIGVNAVE